MGINVITNYDIRLYMLALEYAKDSQCRYKFGAVINKGKKVEGSCNKLKTHPIFKRYGSFCISIHSEISVILKSNFDLHGSTMYIARDSINCSSKPCHTCLSIIIESGIKHIVYHNGNNLVKERIN